MSKRLSDEDRRAVDILLDRDDSLPDGGGDGSKSGAAPAPAELEQRLHHVQATLQLLDNLQAPEPPAHLTNRVFARIEESAMRRAAMRVGAAQAAGIRPTV